MKRMKRSLSLLLLLPALFVLALFNTSCNKGDQPVAPTEDSSQFVLLTDVVPDAIPIAGLGDDLAVLLYVLHKVWGDVSEEVKAKAKAKLNTWFDSDEMTTVDDLFVDDPTNGPV